MGIDLQGSIDVQTAVAVQERKHSCDVPFLAYVSGRLLHSGVDLYSDGMMRIRDRHQEYSPKLKKMELEAWCKRYFAIYEKFCKTHEMAYETNLRWPPFAKWW